MEVLKRSHQDKFSVFSHIVPSESPFLLGCMKVPICDLEGKQMTTLFFWCIDCVSFKKDICLSYVCCAYLTMYVLVQSSDVDIYYFFAIVWSFCRQHSKVVQFSVMQCEHIELLY